MTSIFFFYYSSFLLEKSGVFIAQTYFLICFSKAFPKEGYEKLTCFIIYLSLGVNMFSPVRYSYLSIFSNDNGDIFASSQLILYCSFLSLILSSIVMISFYILSERFFLEREGLAYSRVGLVTEKEYGFAVHSFKKVHKFIKVNI